MKIYHYMTGPLQVNTYLVYDDNKIGYVVDPGGPSRQLETKIKDENITLQYIVLTHGHCDHIGGVEALKTIAPEVKIIAHREEVEMLTDASLNSSMEICGRPVTVTPDILVTDEETMKIGDMDLRFLHTPGHSKGGMSIYTGGYLFSGDSLFRASIGRTDFYGGSYTQLLQSIRTKLFTLPDETVVLPGHMGETNIAFEKENNPFVR